MHAPPTTIATTPTPLSAWMRFGLPAFIAGAMFGGLAGVMVCEFSTPVATWPVGFSIAAAWRSATTPRPAGRHPSEPRPTTDTIDDASADRR